MAKLFVTLMTLLFHAIRAMTRTRAEVVLENLALKQQVMVLEDKHPRPTLTDGDRAFWVALRSVWSRWAKLLVIVEPDTVVRWRPTRFRRYWTKLSQRHHHPGRPRVDADIRKLIRCMATDNDWGAPRIHGELLKLGYEVSERTISRYLLRRPAPPDVVKRWVAFLRNHGAEIAAMDFFVVPTATMRVLHGFFVIEHGRRRIRHFNATDENGTAIVGDTWTGSHAGGNAAAAQCSDWVTENGNGRRGMVDTTGGGWFGGSPVTCGGAHRLYCIR